MEYIRKVFPHDLHHEVSLTNDIHSIFFNGVYYLNFTKFGSSTIYNVTVNNATDLRFGGDFKSMLPYTLQVGDFICIKELGGKYDLHVEKASSAGAKKYNGILGVNQRHIIFNNSGVVIYVR